MQNKESDSLYIPDQRECMTCGFCIPRCPTFKMRREEAESPRGRLRIISALLSQNSELSGDDLDHLSNCLQCRACEAVCPSKMPYSRLLDAAKVSMQETRVSILHRLIRRVLLDIVAHPKLLRSSAGLLRGYQRTGLRTLLKRSGLLRVTGTERLDNLLPLLPKQKPLGRFHPAIGTKRGTVGLFTGCMSDASDKSTLSAAVYLLNRFGFDVHIPESQRCCGAVHLHHGEGKKAAKLAQANILAFQHQDLDAIVYTASGCGRVLTEYPQNTILPDPLCGDVDRFSAKLKDVNVFLAEVGWPDDLVFAPLEKTVAVHEPCSQRNGPGHHKQAYELLEHIPGLTSVALDGNEVCCGAGGTHMVTHPEIAVPLRDEKMKSLDKIRPDILVTSNISCAIHLAAGIRQTELGTEVIHPIELLARQLPRDGLG